jgi:dCMP deaminase
MRITRDEWGLRLAEITALRGTCLRRQVGCVLINAAGHVLATGYNGVARGLLHCNEVVKEPIYGPERTVVWNGETFTTQSCLGFKDTTPHACSGAGAASGTDLDLCEAVHAEANAISQCRDVDAITTCFVTVSPCVSCIKMLMNTGCQRIVFREVYAHDAAKDLWFKRPDVEWLHQPRV